MVLKIKGYLNDEKVEELEVPAKRPLVITTFKELKNQPVSPTNNVQDTSSINNSIIKPKYIQDKSVVYKSSSYIKDLLGEGN